MNIGLDYARFAMQTTTNEPYEPTDQDIQFLNELDQGYVGITKPKVVFKKFNSNLISQQQALEEDGDYLPIDMQGWQ